jgi:hypothetical protein
MWGKLQEAFGQGLPGIFWKVSGVRAASNGKLVVPHVLEAVYHGLMLWKKMDKAVVGVAFGGQTAEAAFAGIAW